MVARAAGQQRVCKCMRGTNVDACVHSLSLAHLWRIGRQQEGAQSPHRSLVRHDEHLGKGEGERASLRVRARVGTGVGTKVNVRARARARARVGASM